MAFEHFSSKEPREWDTTEHSHGKFVAEEELEVGV
jgi:hypothetical protein